MESVKLLAARYNFHGHDEGLVITQPRAGEFEQRPMTVAELAAREPAHQIAADIYRHANYAGVCYYELWQIIAKAIDADRAELARREEAAFNIATRRTEESIAHQQQRDELLAALLGAIPVADGLSIEVEKFMPSLAHRLQTLAAEMRAAIAKAEGRGT